MIPQLSTEYIQVQIIIIALAAIMAWGLSKVVPNGWVAGLFGAVIVIGIAHGVAALTLFLWGVAHGQASLFNTFWYNLGGTYRHFLGLGLSYPLPGMLIATAVYAAGRYPPNGRR